MARATPSSGSDEVGWGEESTFGDGRGVEVAW